ncbi:MAG: hypothetical protein KF760_11680 [Candidatus Eremiobacteraeota bacterium]|nr:hypothetical protein [Candidatus Eremiobacteraeota bacterium]
MQELLYSLKVPASGAGRAELAALLDVDPKALPERVRISTLSPLSNRGYSADAEAEVIRLMPEGLLIGTSTGKAPRMVVPWQNLAYLSEE